jgi:outer membrane usher protein
MKRITTARVREYALLPVTAGRAVALATVPTMMFCLSPLSRAMADDYFDLAALEFADPQQQTSDLHFSPNPAASSRGLTLSPWWLMTRSWVRLISRLLTMAGSCARC